MPHTTTSGAKSGQRQWHVSPQGCCMCDPHPLLAVPFACRAGRVRGVHQACYRRLGVLPACLPAQHTAQHKGQHTAQHTAQHTLVCGQRWDGMHAARCRLGARCTLGAHCTLLLLLAREPFFLNYNTHRPRGGLDLLQCCAWHTLIRTPAQIHSL